MSKHIVIDARIIASSTGRYVRELLKNLEKVDQENRYTVIVRPEDENVFKPTNSNFSVLTADIPDFSFKEQFALKKLLKELHPDLVHFTMPQHPLLYRGKKVISIHDLTLLSYKNHTHYPSFVKRFIYRFKYPVYKYILRHAAKSSEHIIVPSRWVKTAVVKRYKIDPSRVSITYEAAEIGSGTPKPVKELKGKEFLMYVGRAWPYKNIGLLIDAMEQLNSTHPNLHLALVGKKEFNYEKHQKDVNNRGIKNVIFTDFVSDEELSWLFKNTKAYVFPSLSEGFGLPGLEAIEKGATLLSSNATCLPEIYGQAAIYFDPKSVEDLVLKIKSIIYTKTEQTQKQNTTKLEHRLVPREYTWFSTTNATLDVYKNILGR